LSFAFEPQGIVEMAKKEAGTVKDSPEQKEKKRKRAEKEGHGKLYAKAAQTLNKSKKYTVKEAFELLEKMPARKFDESVDIAFNLGVDPKHADQMVRGAIVLPNGIGKSARVLVIAKGDKAKEAEAAGADHVGSDDMVKKIQEGWMEFDKVIATPDMMAVVSRVARVLGPRGLMPNPKLGTVTPNVKQAVEDQKKGKMEYRTEKTGIIHAMIGKKSFGAKKLQENFVTLASVILRAKPPTSKGTYLQKITVSTTMGPGIQLDAADVASVGA